MTKSNYVFLILSSFLLFACGNNSTYNEAEFIRKMDALQHTVDDLSEKVVQLEKKIEWISNETKNPVVVTTTLTTTIPIATSIPKTIKITTKTTAKTSLVTTSSTKSIFVGEEFAFQLDLYKKQISLLSQRIASTIPSTITNEKIDQFYGFQKEIKIVEGEINQYLLAMKEEYDKKQLTQEEFLDKERSLSKLNDALYFLEEQLEVKFEVGK